MPSLLELEANFLKVQPDGSYLQVPSLADADGVLFLCPLCYQTNRGRVGTHSVLCWFEGVPDHLLPAGRWKPHGTGLQDLSFVPGLRSNSVLLGSGCRWHGFVTKGVAE